MALNSDTLIYALPFIIVGICIFAGIAAVYQVFQITKYSATFIGAIRKAQKEGKTGQALSDDVQLALGKQLKAQQKTNSTSTIGNAAALFSKLLMIAFVSGWLWFWMHVLGQAMPEVLRQTLVYGILGFEGFVAAFVLIRGIAKFAAPHTKPEWIDVVADTNSKWEILEGRLLLAAFLAVFVAAWIPMYYLIQSH